MQASKGARAIVLVLMGIANLLGAVLCLFVFWPGLICCLPAALFGLLAGAGVMMEVEKNE